MSTIAWDWRPLFAVGLYGETRRATEVELTPCRACATWPGHPHLRARVLEPPPALEFFEAYQRGVEMGRPSLTEAAGSGR